MVNNVRLHTGIEIAFVGSRNGDLGPDAMKPDGSELRTLKDEARRDFSPAWSSDAPARSRQEPPRNGRTCLPDMRAIVGQGSAPRRGKKWAMRKLARRLGHPVHLFPGAALFILLALAMQGQVLAASIGPLALVLEPADFGTVVVGTTERLTVTAKNTSVIPLTVTRVTALDAPFRIDSNSCSGKVLLPGATCQVTVAFTPRTVGSFSAALEIRTGEQSSTADLTGIGSPGSTTTTQPGGPTTTQPAATTIQPRATTTRPAVTSTAPTTTEPGVATTQPGVTTTRLTGPTTSSVPDDQRLRECERQARDAKVSYVPRQAIELGETLRVQVSASIDDVTVTTSTPTTGRVTTTVVPVTLRCEVQAQLRGEDFRVNPSEFQVGSFLDRPVVTWSWDVVPLKAGTRTLTLEIRSVADIGGRKIPGAGGELFTTAIDVGVKPEDLGEKLTRWSGDVVEHPLITGFGSLAVAAAALAAAWRWLLKRPWPWTKKSKPAAPRRRKARR